MLAHATSIVEATELPVSADLENLERLEDIRQVVASVDAPVDVLARPGVPAVPELTAVGVSRVSVGGGFAFAALGALVEAANELRTAGTYGFWDRASVGLQGARSAFGE